MVCRCTGSPASLCSGHAATLHVMREHQPGNRVKKTFNVVSLRALRPPRPDATLAAPAWNRMGDSLAAQDFRESKMLVSAAQSPSTRARPDPRERVGIAARPKKIAERSELPRCGLYL
eukprot:6205595-Pleurochrysis_carterae.AAC.2